MPEELCQVCCKSHYFSLALHSDPSPFTLTPLKNWFLAPKRPNLAWNCHIWPNICIIGPFDPMPDQKTMRTSCLGGFPLCGYENFYLLPWKLGFLAQKRPNLAPNMHFWSFCAKYWPIWSIWCHAQPIKQCERGASLALWYVCTRTFASSCKKNRMFGRKTAIFAPKYAFSSTYRPLAHLVPCWLVVVAHGLFLTRHLSTLWEVETFCWVG